MPSIANATSSEPHPALATIGKGEGDGVGLILLRNNLGPHKLADIRRGMGIEMASFGAFVFNGLEGSKRTFRSIFGVCQSLKDCTQTPQPAHFLRNAIIVHPNKKPP